MRTRYRKVGCMGTQSLLTWQDFGAFLQQVRGEQGMSQERLAAHLNCHRTYVYRLEHGARRPSKTFLRLILHAMPLSAANIRRLQGFEYLLDYQLEVVDLKEVFVDVDLMGESVALNERRSRKFE